MCALLISFNSNKISMRYYYSPVFLIQNFGSQMISGTVHSLPYISSKGWGTTLISHIHISVTNLWLGTQSGINKVCLFYTYEKKYLYTTFRSFCIFKLWISYCELNCLYVIDEKNGIEELN